MQWHKCFGNLQAEGCMSNAMACQPLLTIEIGGQAKIDAAKTVCVEGKYSSDACLEACIPGMQCLFSAISGVVQAHELCAAWEEACIQSLPELQPCVACEDGAEADFPCLMACMPYVHCVGKGCGDEKAAACEVLKSVAVVTNARKVARAENACSKDAKGPNCVRDCMPGIRCVIDHFAGGQETSGCSVWLNACKNAFSLSITKLTLAITKTTEVPKEPEVATVFIAPEVFEKSKSDRLPVQTSAVQSIDFTLIVLTTILLVIY